MRPEEFRAQAVADLLKKEKVASMNDLKRALGTTSRMTVCRKLQTLGYLSSYSHGGKYYTLETVPKFDSQGLWSHRSIWFSRLGTLVATAESFVTQSEGGYFVRELDKVLHVGTKGVLQKLVIEKRLRREKVLGWYVYCAGGASASREQLRARKILEAELILSHGLRDLQVSSDELKAATILVYSTLNEKQCRLCAGLESLRLGYGGDRRIADLLGMSVHTVAKGRKELLTEDLDLDRLRKPGGGRKSIKKKRQR